MSIGGALGGLVSGFIGANAAKKGNKAQQAAIQQALAIQNERYDEITGLLEPTIDLGSIAQQAVAFERGLGPAPVISNAGFSVGGQTHETREMAEDALTAATERFNQHSNVRTPVFTRTGSGGDGQDDNELLFGATGGDLGHNGFETTFDPNKGISAAGFDPRGASIEVLDPQIYQGFQFSPDHKFLLDQGLDAVSAQASALGSRNSGATQQALQERGTNLANTFREQYLASLGALSDNGLGAIGQQIAAGTNNANANSNLFLQSGNAEAASKIAVGNQLGQAAQSGFSLIDSISGLGGGGAGGISSLAGMFGGGGGAAGSAGSGGIGGLAF